jgi:flagellar assembly factor FliW
MSDESAEQQELITFASTRFGELQVPAESVIEFPSGVIGFPHTTQYVMLEHKHPFSWLHSVQDANLAFVVVDGFEFGQQFDVKPPIGNKDTDLREDDEYAILIIVTVRADPRLTTANLKAPLFVNMRNRRGVQIIFDDARYSTRFPLWNEESQKNAEQPSADPANSNEKGEEGPK